MIVVTTPTGHIGSKVVANLLAAQEKVRVIARDPARLAAEVRANAEIAQGSSDDESVLMRALEDAESLFLVVPPSFMANDVGEYYLGFTRPVCRAIERQGVKRIVTVSGVGRRSAVNAGPITASHAKDAEIERTGVAFRALWCATFMENLLRQIESLKYPGVFFSPNRPDLKAPLVATRDIAARGGELLLDRSWTGQDGIALLGPEDLSFNDMAEVMTDVLGKPICFQSMPADQYHAQLIRLGASKAVARSLMDMHAAIDKGLASADLRTPESTSPTTFRQWCEEILKPALQS